ncbi:MAG TPA: NAD(P)H-hydrate dehydratase [Candidatus Polarisedimenticolia bacterium]|nr:NAD(P)H-hydrate dehydratase [Candidatus Polarisedimenticolia bacterium]
MKILTSGQMRRIDERTESRHGISSETLMDNAGRGVAETLLALYPSLAAMRPVIVCGKGNNGGDGISAARHLRSRGVRVRVVLLSEKSALAGPAARHLERAEREGVVVEEAPTQEAWTAAAAGLSDHGLIVDALLGTGLKNAARGAAARAIADINAASAEVVALDIPSGLSGDGAGIPGPAVSANHTIALACPKLPHVFHPAAALCGRLHLVEIGIPAEAVEAEGGVLNLITESEIASLMPMREPDCHKGDCGRLLVVGGSAGKAGAGALVSLAALRSGAGLVTAATAVSAQPILAGHLMEMMTEPLEETPSGAVSRAAAPRVRELLESADVLALGPGLTAGEETAALVREIVAEAAIPVVLDADGINAFAGRPEALRGDQRLLILTPHPGEMARLLSGRGGRRITAADVQADRIGLARSFATEHSCYVVLKGHNTVVADPSGQVWINPTGNPGMATAGCGDVLTGVVAALLGQGLSPLEACLLGVYAHGIAADLASADVGEVSLMARDIIEYLSEAFQRLERAAS